mgnify:CR=1 FL=1
MKKLNIIYIFFALLCSSCSLIPAEENIVSNSIISNFEMQQENSFSTDIITIKSPEAIINNDLGQILIKDTEIIISTDDQDKFIIKANSSTYENLSRLINASGNIRVSDLNTGTLNLRGEKLLWSLDSETISLISNVYLNTSSSDISSENAFINLKSKIINFPDLNYYKLSLPGTSDSNKVDIDINSDTATFNDNNSTFTFKSHNAQVESTISIYQ